MALFAAGLWWKPAFAQEAGAKVEAAAEKVESFKPFSLFSDPKYDTMERVCLIVVLVIAFAGLAYAIMLVGQVKRAERGTEKMQQIAAA
ncbi:MAG: sodium-translocating pyrophosphatase, partial [Phycisphaerales bacterium]